MDRVVVIGTSCTGKATLAQALARTLGVPHIELDRLHWLPEWQTRPFSEFWDMVRSGKPATALGYRW